MADESKSESATAAPPEGDAPTPAEDATDETKSEDSETEASSEASETAEDAKAEEPKDEDAAKAEEPKAEEPKTEEPKTEDPKAEEPKADAAKAEEPKKDAAKAEEPKTDAAKAEDTTKGGHKKGKKPPKPQKEEPAPAPKKEKEEEKSRTARLGEDPEKTAQDLLFENLPMVLVVCVVFSLIPVWWTYASQNALQESQQAWTDYGDAAKKSLEEAEFDKLVQRHGDTTAAPYIKIKWAAKLYETGQKANVEKARDLLKAVARDHSDLDLIKTYVQPQIKAMDDELGNPLAVWAPPSKPADAGGSSTAPPGSGSPPK